MQSLLLQSQISSSKNKMHLLAISLYFLLLGSTFFSTKLVLTSLGFQYPMVFQGWQTLVGFLLYRLFHSFKVIKITSIDLPGYISLFPVFLLFTGSILTGSMALANIPLLSFLAVSGIVPVVIEAVAGHGWTKGQIEKIGPKLKIGLSVTVIGTNLAMLILEQTFWKRQPYFWLEIHCLCQISMALYGNITDARFNSVDRQYYSYIFALIVLLPASLYLQEAFEALNFKELYQIMFVVGSLVCAISSVMLSFYQSVLRKDMFFGRVHHTGLAIVSLLSLLVFELDFHSYWSIPLSVISVLAAVLIPTHLLPEETSLEDDAEGLMEDIQII